jgi:ATP-dependent Lon protease
VTEIESRSDAERAAKPVVPEDAGKGAPERLDLPDDVLIVLPVRRMVQFPGVVVPIAIGRPGSIAAAQAAARAQRPVGVVMQREAETAEPRLEQLHDVGALAQVVRYVTTPDGGHHVVCAGQERIRLKELVPGHPFLAARYEVIPEPDAHTPEIDARFLQLKSRALEALGLLSGVPDELIAAVANAEAPGRLADLVAHTMDLESNEKQEVLETIDLIARLDRVLDLLAYRIEVLKLSRDIGRQTQETLTAQQREHVLRQQLREIQKQLGETDATAAEVERLKETVEAAGMPEEVKTHTLKELTRLERIPEAAAEHGMLRSYLETMVELPWARPDPKTIDIAEARAILDEDHFGLEKIKKRILEHLAVRKLNPEGKSPILCFVGPPGVGKTSLGQSIARAMGRKFARLSLGGVHDEAEIRGHRMTYVGALPGNIIQTIRRAGARDCVLMLDEMDKLGQSFRGDPASALLEVLDPEQNGTFRDNYLAVPFDLSQVVFIGTANVLDAIPGPLRDRMEVIELVGYTEEEKLQIAKRYLIKRQLEANGLEPEQAEVSDAALSAIIRDYTREAGVRNLERAIGGALRHAAVKIAEGAVEQMSIGVSDLPEILGARKFENEIAMRTSVPGVATGLAWTPVGGDILFIEAARSPGSGRLILTGQLGDVMKESAQAALTLLKSRAASLGVDEAAFEKTDVHVHVPAGAIPKDGPSAGVAMFVALASLFTERCAKSDLAMTGEISLRGLVLPIGGVKEKVIAAARAGLKTVMLPARNQKDFEDIPESARKELAFVWLETVEDALVAALEDC